MFKGITKEFQERLEKFNEESDFFVFSFSDLERGNHGMDSNKYYLYSEELRQKLANIIQKRKQLGDDIASPKSIFCRSFFKYHEKGIGDLLWEHEWWLIIAKDSIYQMAREGAEQKKRGFLLYDEGGGITIVENLSGFFGTINSREIGKRERRLTNEMIEKIKNLRSSVLSEINQIIAEVKVDVSDLEICYPHILPDYCRCEVIPNLDGTLKDYKLYQHHINNCLGRSEQEITDFRDKMLEQIQLGKEKFENYRNSIINDIKALFTEKGVSEKSALYSNWENRLLNMRFRKDLEEGKLSLIKCIESFAKVADEAAREEIRKQAQKEADRLVREQEKKKKQEDQAKVQREKTENLQREKERKARGEELEKHLEKEKNKQNLPEEFKHLTLTEVREKAKTLLNQSLTTNSLQITDLPPEFHQWEGQLKKMKTKEEVFLYQSFIMQAIERKVESKKSITDHNDKQNPLNLPVIVGGTIVLVLFLFFLVKKVKKDA